MQSQPLIAVRDVEAASRWYQELLGCESGHGGPDYEQLVRDGTMILQLHAWGAHDHPNLDAPGEGPLGHGVLLWFATDDFEGAHARAVGLGADIIDGPRVNPNAMQWEIWIRDPDGYVVVIAGPQGAAA